MRRFLMRAYTRLLNFWEADHENIDYRGAGFIGSAVVRLAIRRGHSVVMLMH